MPTESRSAVLHLSAAAGGGVDRYIRDLAASGPRRQYIWHVGSGLDVIEDLALQRFLPFATDRGDVSTALRAWLRASGIGVVHLHGVDAPCRDRLALVERAAATPWIVTLHDLTFVNPRAFDEPGLPLPDAAWIAEISDALSRAAAVVAPSAFIREVALQHFPELRCEVVAPGLGPRARSDGVTAPAEFAAQRPRHVVAAVGAIGPHKGSALLDSLVEHIEDNHIGLVVIGYTDTQLTRGWRVPGDYFVHGPYLDHDLPGLLEAYRVDVALFPNRLPESFSYTLSEVWAAGVPVLVPDEGALGERVARHGGGWRLPAGFSAEDAASLLRRVLSPDGAVERARVKSQIDPLDAERIPALDAMSREIDALYDRFALPPPSSAPDDAGALDALAPLLAANLDGFVFRKELLRLTDELAQTKIALSEAALRTQLESHIVEAQAWARKLERDIATLQAEIAIRVDETRRLADDKAAFDQLPLIVRKLLLKKAFRARR